MIRTLAIATLEHLFAHRQQRLSALAAFLLVQLADLQKQPRDDILIPPRLTRRIERRLFPL